MAQHTLPRFDLIGWAPEDVANPYPIYQRYREDDAVHWSPGTAGSPGSWYVFGYDDVVSVLSSQHFGRSPRRARGGDSTPEAPVPAGYDSLGRIVSNWLVFLDPPRHAELRSLINKEFSPKVVTALRARIQDIATDLIAQQREKPVIELVNDFAAPLPILVISDLLGVPRDLYSWFRECAVSLQQASTARVRRCANGYARAEDAARELGGYFRREAQRRRSGDHHDLVSLLAQAQDRGEPLTDDEIMATCIHLLTAGHETTTNLLGKSVLALLRNPPVLRELRAHPGLMPGAVEELVRYDSPVQMVTRWAYRDEMLRGRAIHRGDKVVLVLGSANRDPHQFPNPDALCFHRGSSRHCGFGLGIHYCLGATLARAEAEIGLTTLLDSFPTLSLTDEPAHYADDMVFHGPTRLVLRIEEKS
ncbi:MAG: cytochrome P450 [Pseudonocardiales bacterium]|nr:cytochrome P450 [Pseudonocardiales bacterium]